VAVHDGLLVLLWSAVFAGGLGVCLWLSRRGVARTYVRDVLHVGAGVWPLGWKAWESPWPPVGVALTGFLILLAIPLLARWLPAARAIERAVSGDGEAWSGLVLYALSAAVFTAVALLGNAPLPAAAALLALALGDGFGGLVGRLWGRHRYRVPWAKTKSVQGSLAVALLAALGTAMAASLFDAPISVARMLGAGLAAAVAEALAPRATDNVLVPLAVWVAVGGLESAGPP
jgi:dolichol kinase